MKLIGKYQVLGLLGRGGMGVVHKVAAPGGWPLLALKLLRPNDLLTRLWGRAEVRRRFAREARLLAGLRHPNLVAVLDMDLVADPPYYVMEYLCDNLGQLIGEGYDPQTPSRALRPERALALTRQALAGLAALHRAGVVHRDFKPYNLLLDDQGRARLADLGLSRLRGERRPGPANLKVGSPHYAAPEQVADPESAGPAADLYAVAVCLHRLLTGLLPGALPASALAPGLDSAWDDFFGRALAVDPARRPASAGRMIDDLRALGRRWAVRRGEICALARPWPGVAQSEASPVPLPARPAKFGPKQARQRLGLDELWRPLARPARLAAIDDRLARDLDRGLIWQRGGSGRPMDWPSAQAWAAELAQSGFAGRHDWRLPTAAEAATLIVPPPAQGGPCHEPIFDQAQSRLWTSDRASFRAAWMVGLRTGFVGRQDFTCRNHVRVVGGPAL